MARSSVREILSRDPLTLLPRGAFAALLFGLALLLLWIAVSASGASGHDFLAYWNAGVDVLEGHSPYHADVLGPFVDAKATGSFRYPPPFALLGVPFVLLGSFSVAVAAWQLMSVLAWGVTCAMLWRRAAGRLPVIAPAMTVMTIAVWSGLVEGNISWLLASLFVWVFLALERGRDRLAGALVAIGALAKLEPGLFLVLLAGRRRWQAVLAAVVTAGMVILVSALSPALRAGWADFPQVLTGLMSMNSAYPQNLAPSNLAVSAGLLSAEMGHWLDRGLLLTAVVGAWLAGRRWSLFAGWAATSLLLLLGAGVIWPHYPAILLGPVLVGLAVSAPEQTWQRRWLWAAAWLGAWLWANLAEASAVPYASFWLALLPLGVMIWRLRHVETAAESASAAS